MSARFLIFSHDSYGLGHVRRSALIASALVAADPDAECLIVSGSPKATAFKLPDRVDVVKLPSITKDSDGSYRARRLSCDQPEISALRGEITLAAVRSYRPDVILVDHAPLGAARELESTLDWAATADPRPALVLGLRDIIDEAAVVARNWLADGTWDELRRFDHMFVYGDENVRATVDELDVGTWRPATIEKVGYVAPAMPDPESGEPFLLVTAGGGGDGHRMVRSVLDALEAGPIGLPVRIVTGPLMSKGRQAELLRRTAGRRDIELIDFTPNLRQWMSSATAMVSMAGYNTVAEALVVGVPTLLVPRTEFRREQLLRAERMSEQVDHVSWVPVDELDRPHLEQLLRTPRRFTRPTVDLHGAHRVANRLLAIAHGDRILEVAQ